jgi:predicted secreted Zn-dependent protease
VSEHATELEDAHASRWAEYARVAAVETASLPAARADVARLAQGPAGGPLLLRLQQGSGNRAVAALLQRCACGCGGGAGCHEEEAGEERGVARAMLQLKENLDAQTTRAIQRDDDTGGPIVLDDAPAAPGGGVGGAAPVFKHSGSTVTINADSAIDFSNNITAQIGTPHTEIELEPDVQWEIVGGVKKVSSVGLTVTTKIVKVRFGMGRPNDKHKKAIDEMVAAIKAHEEQHRAVIVAAATAGLAKAQTFVGTTKIKEAWKALDTGVSCVAAKQHEALDAKEGLLTASEDANGNVTVTKSPSGATYPCPPATPVPTP